MGEIRPKRCEGRELTKDQLDSCAPGPWSHLLAEQQRLRTGDYPFPATCDPKTGKAARVTHTWPEEYDAHDAQVSKVVPDWRNRKTPLGCQFIIALTDFTPTTGGT